MRRRKQPSWKWLIPLFFCIAALSACLIFFPSDPEGESDSRDSYGIRQEEESSVTESLQTESSETESSEAESSEETSVPKPPVRIPADTEVNAVHAFVYDIQRGLLYAKGEMDEPVYEASITKLYTAYVGLQILDPQEVITVGNEVYMVSEDASLAYVMPGHRLTVEMLIQGMIMPSGNDAAYALAAAAGRKLLNDEEADAETAVAVFMARMNDTAKKEGFINTNFVTPDGDHSEGHYTCMQDLIVMAERAMSSIIIMKYANCSYEEVTYADGSIASWYNGNLMVHPESEYFRPEVLGLKTGTTDEAGCCLLTAARWDSEVIIGVLGCEEHLQRFEDTIVLLDAYKENIL